MKIGDTVAIRVGRSHEVTFGKLVEFSGFSKRCLGNFLPIR